jgi:ankyrin repeat protein
LKKLILTILLNTFLFSNQLSQKELNFNLIRYSYIGDFNKVKEFHKKGASIDNYKDNSTALLWAVFKDNIKIAKYLIEHNASLQMQSQSGRNILHYAVQKSNLEFTKYT